MTTDDFFDFSNAKTHVPKNYLINIQKSGRILFGKKLISEFWQDKDVNCVLVGYDSNAQTLKFKFAKDDPRGTPLNCVKPTVSTQYYINGNAFFNAYNLNLTDIAKTHDVTVQEDLFLVDLKEA